MTTWELLADPVTATKAVLLESDVTGELVGERVYGAELPRSQASSMPQACIVVAEAGSGPGTVGTDDRRGVKHARMDIRYYGATPHEAKMVSLAAHYVLKRWHRRVIHQMLVYDFTLTAGPIRVRDPATDWPLLIETWQVLCADELVT